MVVPELKEFQDSRSRAIRSATWDLDCRGIGALGRSYGKNAGWMFQPDNR